MGCVPVSGVVLLAVAVAALSRWKTAPAVGEPEFMLPV